MRKTLRRVWLTGIAVVLAAGFTSFTSAESTSYSYTYNKSKQSVAVPVPYSSDRIIWGEDTFYGKALNSPVDLFVSTNNEVYILDAGNQRLVVLDSTLAFAREITLQKNGQPVEFAEAAGLFVASNGKLYVSDKKAGKVYIADAEGRIIDEITAPPADKVEASFEFTPTKVVVDTAGIVYVISANSYSGALQYDQRGEFLGFYGSERIAVSFKVLVNRLWKRILTDEAASGLQSNVPISLINLDIDSENFVYSIRGGTGLGSGQVRKLNPQGYNILTDENGSVVSYGDLETYFDTKSNITVSSTLIDIAVDDRGFITVLDSTRSRLFQYDQQSQLLYAFGGTGTQGGTFSTPVAIDTLGDDLLVLDAGYGSITKLSPTTFAQDVRNAIELYNDGLYEEAMDAWQAVLSRDANYTLANRGMGKIFERQGDYTTAMAYYQLGESKEGYSDAFQSLRDDWIRRYFAWLLGGVMVLLLGMVAVFDYQEKHRKSEYSISTSVTQYPVRCMFHPFKAFYDLKLDKKGRMTIANGILAAFFVTVVIQTQLTGFHFNTSDPKNFNVFITLGSTIGLFLMFVLCNWSISTLADGEGKLKEIWIFTAYALLPFVISTVILTVLSNVFSLEETAFLSIIQIVLYAWTGICLFMAVREAHQYTVGKTIAVLLGTLLFMYLLLLIITVGYSMFTQLIGFITMLFNEIRLR